MRRKLGSTENPRLSEKYPTPPYPKIRFKVGLGICRKNTDSLCDPVYNAFHRNFLLWKRNDSLVVL